MARKSLCAMISLTLPTAGRAVGVMRLVVVGAMMAALVGALSLCLGGLILILILTKAAGGRSIARR